MLAMNKYYINPNWNFKEVVSNIEVIKSSVREIIASFSYFERKQAIAFMYKLRKDIYSLNFETWRCDRIVEYIYDDIDLETLKKLV